MTVDKIGNTISSTVTMHMKIAEKRSHPQLEASDVVSISTKPDTKGTTKTNDPPFFPICVTQSMFKTEK